SRNIAFALERPPGPVQALSNLLSLLSRPTEFLSGDKVLFRGIEFVHLLQAVAIVVRVLFPAGEVLNPFPPLPEGQLKSFPGPAHRPPDFGRLKERIEIVAVPGGIKQ